MATPALASPEFVTRVMRDTRVWEWVGVDGMEAEQFGYVSSATYYQFEDKGFVMFRKSSSVMREIHVAMLRGARNIEPFIFDCMRSMVEQGVRKFLAPIGEWNIPALRLAKRCGYKEEGRIACAYMKNDKQQSLVLMGCLWDS